MTYKEFTQALENRKTIYGNNGEGQVWEINRISDTTACIQMSIKTPNFGYINLHNIVENIKAYEITENIDIKWR